MSLLSIQNSLHRIHREYNSTSNSFYNKQMKTRLQAVPLFANEVWTNAKFLTRLLAIEIPGLIIKAPISATVYCFPKCEKAAAWNAELPTCAQAWLTMKKIVKLISGAFLTLVCGLIANPDLNYRLHVKLGLIQPASTFDADESPTAKLALGKL